MSLGSHGTQHRTEVQLEARDKVGFRFFIYSCQDNLQRPVQRFVSISFPPFTPTPCHIIPYRFTLPEVCNMSYSWSNRFCARKVFTPILVPPNPHTAEHPATAALGRTDHGLSPDLLRDLLLSRWNGADTNDAVEGVGGGGLRGRLLQVLSGASQVRDRSKEPVAWILLARCPEGSDSSEMFL